jgi:hypothetical protein
MEIENKTENEVETYASDMAGVIGDNQDGIVRKIIEEQEKEEKEKEKVSPERKKNQIFLAVGLVFLILAFIAVFLVFLLRKEILMVEVKPQYVPIIFTDQTKFQEVSGLKKEVLAQLISEEAKSTEVKSGGVEGIYLTENEKVLGWRRFLTLSEAGLDQGKLTFVDDNFLLGVVNENTKDFFILIKMRSVADIFDVLLAWEPKMFSDLHGFFGINLNADTKYLLEKNFEDGIIQNKNARILRDNNGEIVLMYVWAEDDSLIITNSEKAAGELIARLAASRIKK